MKVYEIGLWSKVQGGGSEGSKYRSLLQCSWQLGPLNKDYLQIKPEITKVFLKEIPQSQEEIALLAPHKPSLSIE